MARAVLEGIALNARWLRPAAEKYAGRRFDDFTVYGGGARSDPWCQLLANVLGAPVRQLEQAGHANCVGVGLYAFAQLGELDASAIGLNPAIRHTYRPDPATAPVYDELAARFDEARRATKSLFHKLYAAHRRLPATISEGNR
jgi:xylulokinase